jgi:hypothetical protein
MIWRRDDDGDTQDTTTTEAPREARMTDQTSTEVVTHV